MSITKATAFFVVTTFFVLGSFFKAGKSKARNPRVNYSRIISFGDSLSDTGNYNTLSYPFNSNKVFPSPKAGYFEGRASNGYLWTEQIYDLPKDNYAYLGARTDRDITGVKEHWLAPNFSVGLAYQVDLALYSDPTSASKKVYDHVFSKMNDPQYVRDFEKRLREAAFQFNKDINKIPAKTREEKKARDTMLNEFMRDYATKEFNNLIKSVFDALPNNASPRKLDPNGLYTLWVGMNDLRSLEDYRGEVTEDIAFDRVEHTLTNVRESLTKLSAHGAKNFVVLSLPTIFITEKDKEKAERLIKYHNLRLLQELQAISASNKNINIIPIDMQTLGEEVQRNPSEFGFINVTEPCITRGKRNDHCGDPDLYLFWDDSGHLTRKGNMFLARYVREVLEAPYMVVPQMNATETAAISATKNVNNRLFALRGGLHPLSSGASSLIATHFHDDKNSIQNVFVASDFKGTSLPDIKQKRLMHRASAPMHAESKKGFLPSLSSNLGFGKFGVFLAGDLHFGNQRNTDEFTGYRHSTKTLTIGGDYRFADWFLAGIAMSYIRSDTKLKGGRGDIDIDGYAMSLYDSIKFGNFYVDSVVTHGWNQNKITRNLQYFKRQAKGEPLGRHWSVGALAGYDFRFGKFTIGPNAGVRYGESRIQGYKEHGAGAFDMYVSKQRTSSAVSTLGGHMSYGIQTDIAEFTPQIRGSYDHEFKDRSRLIITELASMRGIPYHVPVPNNDHNYGRVGGGLNIRFKNDLSLSLDYETIFARRKARDHFIFGKLRFQF